MTQSIMSIRIKDSGVLALTDELGQRYGLHDGETLTLIRLGSGVFLLARGADQPHSLAEVQHHFGQAMIAAGYDSRSKIVELVRAVKREIADERQAAGGESHGG